MSKKSIRFFNDREVRAVWDEERSKWWFSATDIVRAINDEDDYVKASITCIMGNRKSRKSERYLCRNSTKYADYAVFDLFV